MPAARPLLRLASKALTPLTLGCLVVAAVSVALVAWPCSAAAAPTGPAAPESGTLIVSPAVYLSATDEPLPLTITGPSELVERAIAQVVSPAGPTTGGAAGAAAPPAGAGALQTAVRVYGPVPLDDVGEDVSSLPDPAVVTVQLAAGARSVAPTDPAAAVATTAAAAATVPASALTAPGAYHLTVVIMSGETAVAKASCWVGRVAAEGGPIDVACVWPLVQGVHRDTAGVFFDDAIERALARGTSAGVGAIATLSDIRRGFPEWHFTLALEPIMVTQLAAMSHGYTSRVDAERTQEVTADDQRAQAAGAALVALQELATSDGTDVAAAPYAGASAPTLAAAGWDDGVGQIRLGRQVLQQALGLAALVNGGFSPDLGLSTDSIAAFSKASVDHVLVAASLRVGLDEAVTPAAVTARVRDQRGERVTLVFVDDRLSGWLGASEDVGLFCARLCARASETGAQALVLLPSPDGGLPTASFLEQLGTALTGSTRVRTATLAELARTHAPGSRPVFLDRPGRPPSGYIASSLLIGVSAAREAVEALASAAGDAATPVEKARLLLYTAESRSWSLPGIDPRAATVGLSYALEARRIAEEALGQIVLAGVEGRRVAGRRGVVTLQVENRTDYTLKAELRLQGTGLTIAGPQDVMVEMKPGRTPVTVEVTQATGDARLQAQLVAGSRTVARWDGGVSFLTIATFLPWAFGSSCAADLVRRGGRARPSTGQADGISHVSTPSIRTGTRQDMSGLSSMGT